MNETTKDVKPKLIILLTHNLDSPITHYKLKIICFNMI